MTSRWNISAAPRGADYDAKWERMAAAGKAIHGEADFVERFKPATVLDAGCGTGRVAIELVRRGVDTVGVDLDPSMLEAARHNSPAGTWVNGDLATVDIGRRFDVVVMAGNVMLFVTPGAEADVAQNMVDHLAPGGVLIAGFSLDRTTTDFDLERYDEMVGLRLHQRWATWDREAFTKSSTYAVSVHQAD